MEKRNNSAKTYETITVIVTGLVVVFLILGSRYPGLLYAAVSIGVPALISRRFAGFIERLWMGMARFLGRIVPVILMALLFFLILTPLAWLRRLTQRQNSLHLNNTTTSLFVDHERKIDAAYFGKTW